MRSTLERLEAIDPIVVDGMAYWPRDDVVRVLALDPRRAARQIRAHPEAGQIILSKGSGRLYSPIIRYAAINLPAVLALCTLSHADVPNHVIRQSLEARMATA